MAASSRVRRPGGRGRRGRPAATRAASRCRLRRCRWRVGRGCGHPVAAVAAVVGEGFAGPFAGDQDPAAAEAQGFAAVGLAAAPAGDEAGAGVAGLDAVAEPVRAGGGARLVAQRLPQPFDVVGLGVGVRGVALVDGLGQVLREIPDPPVGITAAGEHALDVQLRPEPDHVRGLGLRVGVQRVERLVPGRQRRAGARVGVGAGGAVEGGEPGVGVDDGVGVRPPHLVIRRRDDGAQHGAGDGAPYGGVQVRGEAALGFDGGEVLHVEADRPAQVLPEPVDQLREVDRVPGRGPVVVGARVDRGAVGGVHPPVERQVRVRNSDGRTSLPSLPRRPGRRCAARRSAGAGPGRPGGGGWTGPADARPQVAVHPGLGELARSPARSRRRPRPCPARHGRAGCGSLRGRRGPRPAPSADGRFRRSATGSVVRCQPSRHCAIRSSLARFAHDSHLLATVDPHGMSMICESPVSVSIRRIGTGRVHTPYSVANDRSTCRPNTGGTRTAGASSSSLVGAASSGAAIAVVVSSCPLVRGTGTSWARATTGQDRKPLPHNRSRPRHVSRCCPLVSVVVR